MSKRATPEQFWARVDVRGPDECWEWQGSCNSGGYGTLVYQGVAAVAHRVAGFLSGKLESIQAPKDRTGTGFGLHACDNTRCCNPAHLDDGTYSENLKQAYARDRKRQPKGTRHANAKLTAAQVRKIRTAYSKGSTQTLLANEFGVSQVAVSLIVRRKTYTEI